jgi:hypothetical protein
MNQFILVKYADITVQCNGALRDAIVELEKDIEAGISIKQNAIRIDDKYLPIPDSYVVNLHAYGSTSAIVGLLRKYNAHRVTTAAALGVER